MNSFTDRHCVCARVADRIIVCIHMNLLSIHLMKSNTGDGPFLIKSSRILCGNS